MRLRAGTAIVLIFALAGCSSTESPDASNEPSTSSSGAAPSSPTSSNSPSPSTAPEPLKVTHPVSVPALAAARITGDRLRLGAVRERTSAYTSYDVTYRSTARDQRRRTAYTISGVLNVPTGRGPFPAVVLAHGYIDPAYYVRGQGMTRERGYLAEQGYVALHIDYRNHAESDDDPDVVRNMRLGYSADAIAAVHALRGADLPVDDDRIAMMGRSMGGGVVMKALIAEPGLVQAAALWASVSSVEAENFERFISTDPSNADARGAILGAYGSPEDDPKFWRGVSARPYFDQITEPVLIVHGRVDDTCPPRWATATNAAMRRAGVDVATAWYQDGHAFGPEFFAAMQRTVAFLDRKLGR